MLTISEVIYSFITKVKMAKDINLQLWTFLPFYMTNFLPIVYYRFNQKTSNLRPQFGFGWICCGAGRKAAEVAFSATAASPAGAASSHEHRHHHEDDEEDEDGSLTSASGGGADSAVADVAPLQPEIAVLVDDVSLGHTRANGVGTLDATIHPAVPTKSDAIQ